MNTQQTEAYMKDLNEMFVTAHEGHMKVIKRYTNGFLAFDAYKELDKKYTVELATITKLINMFLHRKNS